MQGKVITTTAQGPQGAQELRYQKTQPISDVQLTSNYPSQVYTQAKAQQIPLVGYS